MDTQIVQVRAKQSENVLLETAQRGYMSGSDPITGLPYVWYTQPVEVVIPISVLSLLEADPRLEVRRVDPRAQASKRMDLAIAADKEAIEADTRAKQLRAKADMLFEEAQQAMDSAGSVPLPKVNHGTPGTDQMLDALPESVRKEVEQLEPMQRAKELLKPYRQRLAEKVLVSPDGAYEEAVAKAFPDNKAAQEEILANRKKSKK